LRRPLLSDPDDTEDATELVQRLPGRASDGAYRALRVGWVLRKDGIGGGGLDDDHAEVVRDHVVDLAGNPCLLLEHRLSRVRFLLALELSGSVLDRAEVRAARPHVVPEDPGRDQWGKAPGEESDLAPARMFPVDEVGNGNADEDEREHAGDECGSPPAVSRDAVERDKSRERPVAVVDHGEEGGRGRDDPEHVHGIEPSNRQRQCREEGKRDQ
jgi:hypothetical protein